MKTQSYPLNQTLIQAFKKRSFMPQEERSGQQHKAYFSKKFQAALSLALTALDCFQKIK